MSGKEKTAITCDWSAPGRIHRGEKTGKPKADKKKPASSNKSRLYEFKKNFKWKSVTVEKYKLKGKDWSDIIRHTLIGGRGETAKFHLRYFEIASGGKSSFEMHRHEHVVICIRGKGKAVVDKKVYDIKPFDTLYISPSTPHQLKNLFKKPFGFLCIVNAKRDRPKILS